MTNIAPSIVTGSVGIWPAASITGFPPGLIVPGTGTAQAGTAVAQQAQTDNTAAYLALAGLASAPILRPSAARRSRRAFTTPRFRSGR